MKRAFDVGLSGAGLLLSAPLWAVAGGFVLAITTGIAFSVLPARRAAALDPAQALARR